MADGDMRLIRLLSYAISGSSENLPGNEETSDILSNAFDNCLKLMERDYSCEILNNPNGHLCGTYPDKMIIPVKSSEKQQVSKLSEYVLKGRFARTRGRFVVPVLLVDGKYVCRSSTLARSPEIYCRQSYGYWVKGEQLDTDISELESKKVSNETNDGKEPHFKRMSENALFANGVHHSSENLSNSQIIEDGKSKEWLLDKMRNADIQLMRYLNINTIFDLMVENKKVKFGMNVTSSEKVDRQQRYLQFNLLSVPYPGCEFFVEYRDRDYSGEGLKFDWNQDFVDANLHMPDNVQYLSDIDWKEYTNWDLVQLTCNYLKLHLHSLMGDNSSGILLHCISGWDRTPLFVSLVRLSLWADGLVHQSLNAEEMVYFTVAYDWLLFSHQFASRISNGEEIFYFCFDFLKYIYSEEYSMVPHCRNPAEKLPIINGDSNNQSNSNGNHRIGNGHSDDYDHIEIEANQPPTAQHEFSTNGDNGLKVSAQYPPYGNNDNTAVMNINESCCWTPEEATDMNRSSNCSQHENNGFTDIGDFNSKVQATLAISDADEGDWYSCNSNGHDGGEKCVTPILSSLSLKECLDNERSPIDLENSENHSLCATATVNKETEREKKLKAVREMVITAYQSAMQWYQEREQRNNSGIASILFNQITKLVKR